MRPKLKMKRERKDKRGVGQRVEYGSCIRCRSNCNVKKQEKDLKDQGENLTAWLEIAESRVMDRDRRLLGLELVTE